MWLIHRQSATLTISCSHSQDNGQSGQTGICAIGQALVQFLVYCRYKDSVLILCGYD